VSVPRIIDDSTWETAQKMGKVNTLAAMRNVKEGRYLMRYRLTCQCGHSVAGTASIKGDDVKLYYRCNSRASKTAQGKCGLPYFRADYLDTLVWNWLKEWFQDPLARRRIY
jgi:hypothetical protein